MEMPFDGYPQSFVAIQKFFKKIKPIAASKFWFVRHRSIRLCREKYVWTIFRAMGVWNTSVFALNDDMIRWRFVASVLINTCSFSCCGTQSLP